MLVNAQRLSQSAAHSPSRVRKGEALTWCGRQLLCSSRSAFESQIPAHRANTVFAAVSGRTEWAQMSNHCSHTGVEDSATMACTHTTLSIVCTALTTPHQSTRRGLFFTIGY
eukprot:m.378252 g.378252  ORF g.378252 m.378252 type:complete len:112 (-) comp56197_c2_seq23:265-600(-)